MAEKKKAAEPAVMTDEELVAAKVASVRAAQAKFATYTQEQVDYIFYKAAMAADNARIPLAKMAVEETGMGVLEDKITKNHYAAEFVYNHYRNSKTCGIVEEDKEWGIKKVAEPLGARPGETPVRRPRVPPLHYFITRPAQQRGGTVDDARVDAPRRRDYRHAVARLERRGPNIFVHTSKDISESTRHDEPRPTAAWLPGRR